MSKPDSVFSGSVGSSQEIATREWVAVHVLQHSKTSWQGCLVCVALNWGASLGEEALSVQTLDTAAQRMSQKGFIND